LFELGPTLLGVAGFFAPAAPRIGPSSFAGVLGTDAFSLSRGGPAVLAVLGAGEVAVAPPGVAGPGCCAADLFVESFSNGMTAVGRTAVCVA
jgi:hypothetical protein